MGLFTQDGGIAAIKLILEAPAGIKIRHRIDAPTMQQGHTDLTAPG